MGQVTKLADIVSNIADYDSELVIYAVEPWCPISEAMAIDEDACSGEIGK